jgi:hypothetical protein
MDRNGTPAEMRVPTRPKKPGKRAVKRRSGVPPAPPGSGGAGMVLVDLAREFLAGRPTRTLLQLIARLAPLCLAIAALVTMRGGSAGAPVALQIVDLLVLLIAVAAVDQWIVVPVLRGLGNLLRFWASRRSRRESLPNPPPSARLDPPLGPERPA